METWKLFITYVLITLVGVGFARVLVYFVLSAVEGPPTKPKKTASQLASASLRRATELRMNATALYDELCGSLEAEEEEETTPVTGTPSVSVPRKVQRCL